MIRRIPWSQFQFSNLEKKEVWLIALGISAAVAGFAVVKGLRPMTGAFTGVGNAESYSGGDTVDKRLAAARQTLRESLVNIRLGRDLATLCTADGCGESGQSGNCLAVRVLTLPQQTFCREFLRNSATRLFELADASQTLFSVTDDPLEVTERGAPRPVAARTTTSASSPIHFQRNALEKLSRADLVALVAHELGHKVGINDQFVDGPYPSGRDFLDVVGAALSLYSQAHETPVQAPPALPEGITATESCSAGREKGTSFLYGISADMEHADMGQERLSDWKRVFATGPAKDAEGARFRFAQRVISGEKARAIVVSSLYEKMLHRPATAREKRLALTQLERGVPYDRLLADLTVSHEYRGSKGETPTFLQEISLDLLGRSATTSEIEELSRRLTYMDRVTLVRSILNQNEEAMGSLVGTWFREYLNRAPTVVEQESHVIRLKAGVSWETVRAYIAATNEYQSLQSQRFQSKGICVSSASR